MYKEIIAICSEIRSNHINALCGQNVELWGALAKLRKATLNFVMSVRLPVRKEQIVSHWTDLHEICYLSIFGKSVDKSKFH